MDSWKCPQCGGGNIDIVGTEFEDSYCIETMKCYNSNCKARFDNVYHMILEDQVVDDPGIFQQNSSDLSLNRPF